MHSNYTVYKHTSPSGKVYIGITSMPVEKRWGRGGTAYRHQPVIWNAIRKYGWDNFKHEIINDGMRDIDAKELEIALIAEHQSMDREKGYNRTVGGDGTKGWKHTPNQHAALIKHNSRGFLKGRTLSEKTKKKMSASRKDKSAVAQIGLDGKLISIFQSIAEAAKSVNGSRPNIVACCNGRQLTAYDCQWRYVGKEHTAHEVMKGGKYQPIRIVQLTKEMKEVARYDSISSAAKNFGCGRGRSGIAACLNGRANTAYGYRWEKAT